LLHFFFSASAASLVSLSLAILSISVFFFSSYFGDSKGVGVQLIDPFLANILFNLASSLSLISFS